MTNIQNLQKECKERTGRKALIKITLRNDDSCSYLALIRVPGLPLISGYSPKSKDDAINKAAIKYLTSINFRNII